MKSAIQMIKFAVVVIAGILAGAFSLLLFINVAPETGLTSSQILWKYGYPSETHDVITEDGYILALHRIPHGVTEKSKFPPKKGVVFMQPGILCSSREFILMGQNKSLAFILAEDGYDVWIGNSRGTVNSMGHVNLSLVHNATQFWDFSFHEMGVYDIPAMVDYILNTTNALKLYFIGHSQGSAAYLAWLSMMPEYNRKIRIGIQLAPTAYMAHTKNIAIDIVGLHIWNSQLGKMILGQLGKRDLLSSFYYLFQFYKRICSGQKIFLRICIVFTDPFIRWDNSRIGKNTIPNIFSGWPSGGSVKTLLHFLQLQMTDRFCAFDHGPIENFDRFGSFEAPDYPIEKISAPTALFYPRIDQFADKRDMNKLRKRLRNNVFDYQLSVARAGHIDFIFADDANAIIYDRILGLMKYF